MKQENILGRQCFLEDENKDKRKFPVMFKRFWPVVVLLSVIMCHLPLQLVLIGKDLSRCDSFVSNLAPGYRYSDSFPRRLRMMHGDSSFLVESPSLLSADDLIRIVKYVNDAPRLLVIPAIVLDLNYDIGTLLADLDKLIMLVGVAFGDDVLTRTMLIILSASDDVVVNSEEIILEKWVGPVWSHPMDLPRDLFHFFHYLASEDQQPFPSSKISSREWEVESIIREAWDFVAGHSFVDSESSDPSSIPAPIVVRKIHRIEEEEEKSVDIIEGSRNRYGVLNLEDNSLSRQVDDYINDFDFTQQANLPKKSSGGSFVDIPLNSSREPSFASQPRSVERPGNFQRRANVVSDYSTNSSVDGIDCFSCYLF